MRLRRGAMVRWRTALIAVLGFVVLTSAGCRSGQVGLVDSRRIITESARALRFQKDIDDRERAMAQDLQMLANQLSKEDLDARRAQYFQELQAIRAQLEQTLNREVHDALQQVVKEKRLRGVMTKGPVVYSRPGSTVDITQDVIDRLR